MNKLMTYLHSLKEDAKALRRGDVRVVPRMVNRGRVYAKKDGGGGTGIRVHVEPVVTLRPSAVIDGETGKRYTPEDWRAREDR